MATNNQFKKKCPHAVILSWLESRQRLVVALNAVNQSIRTTSESQVAADLGDFGTWLIDYVSQGHFEVFETLCHHFSKAKVSFSKVSGQLLQTTEIALVFHDKYVIDLKKPIHFDLVKRDLSTVAEALAMRFELEDFLLS